MKDLIFLIELMIVFVLIIDWAVWEFRKTSKLHKKTLEDERARDTEKKAATETE